MTSDDASVRRLARICLATALLAIAASAAAAVYHVDASSKAASDENPGTADKPWRTLGRAGAAKELKPGDTVLVHSGVYREHVRIEVSGDRGKPVTFAAAPGALVVIKGSEPVSGRWQKVSDDPGVKEPYPNAFADVWKTVLGDEHFTDPRFEPSYRDKAKRWVSQVFLADRKPLQRIGPSHLYRNEPYLKLATVGRGLNDLIQDSFYFDPADQTLYVKMAGHPDWFGVEVGVRGFVLTAEKVHDVVLRGFEMRHNRQPGGQWPMVALGQCERVAIEDCRIHLADFCGLGVGSSRDCTVRRCDLSFNGNTGLGMGKCVDCVIEDCTLLFNNYRRFHPGWHAGGMKCIPANRGCTVRRCEAAYNVNSDGIWFDAENADIRIVGNVSHHNDGCGIFFEINKGGGIIADNLVYANRGRGIYLSGSQNTWIVHNTVACNLGGIVCMPRGDEWPLANVHVRNNLLVRNAVATPTFARGADLTLFMGCADESSYRRTVTSNSSDHNVFANAPCVPMMRHSWNPDNTLEQWRARFGEDAHSKQAAVAFERRGTGFRLLTDRGLDAAAPLPESLPWRPRHRTVGSSIVRWPR